MKVILKTEDYEPIAAMVRKKLRQLMPDNELHKGDIIFGPEFMAQPLRISTPATRVEFVKEQVEYVSLMRKQINESDSAYDEKKRKMQNLESIILFGQILFAQAASLHFLQKNLYEDPAHSSAQNTARTHIEEHLKILRGLVDKEGIQFSSSKFEALSRRKEFNEHLGLIKHAIKEAPLDDVEKHSLLSNLVKAKGFYYQANDFNFKHANKPSRSFSNFLNSYEYYGSKIALAASMIAIGATALALIPPLAPIMGPIAIAASAIALAIGMPLALKNVGTMLYNLIRFGAAPTPGELINASVLGTSLLLSGIPSVVGQAVSAGLIGQSANSVTQGVNSAMSAGKIALGIKGQVAGLNSQAKVNLYKAELEKMKSPPELTDDMQPLLKS